MRSAALRRLAAIAAIAVALGTQGRAQAPLHTHYEGTINDYVQALGTTWLVSGGWSMKLTGSSGTGDFTASLCMFVTANPAAVAHTHHVVLRGGDLVVADDWSTTSARFTLGGDGDVTGNGGLSWAGAPVEVTISGGSAVTYSNIRLKLGGNAEGHFGPAPLGGVVNAHR